MPRINGLFGAFAVLFGLAIAFGFLNTLREAPLGDFYAEWMALVFFSGGAALLLPLLPCRFPVHPTLLIGPALLAALLALQLLLGRYQYVQDVVFWVGYLSLALLAVLVGQGVRAAGVLSEVTARVAWALVLVATLNSLAQIIQAGRAESSFSPFVVALTERSICRLYGNIGQANQATTLAWLGIGGVLYLKGVARLSSLLSLPFLVLLLVGSALSASRMAWLFAAVVAGGVLLFQSWPERHRRTRWMIAAMLFAGFAAANYGAATVLAAVDGRCVTGAARLAVPNEAGTEIRLDLWRQAIEVWGASPLIGVGAFNFLPTVYQMETLDKHHAFDIYPHNTALQLLAEFGLVGAGALVAIFIYWIAKLVLARRSLTSHDAVLLVWLAIISVHALLEFPLHYSYFLILFGIMLGMLVRPEWSRAPMRSAMRRPMALLVVTLLGGAAFAAVDYVKFDRLFWLEDQRMAYSAAPTPEVRGMILAAGADIWLFRSRADHLMSLSDPMTKDELSRKIAETDRLLAHTPQPVIMARRIILSVLDDDLETARLHIRRLLFFAPHAYDEMAHQMRRFIENRPKEFATLEPILKEELERRPKPRW
ncbi:MAG: O-antigen ligase C-terminal domain-containing protein [Burkholderiales bacterium]|nr:O-antigen ligase C-terminal domain-containing protein [Burkholderiales bacterium]